MPTLHRQRLPLDFEPQAWEQLQALRKKLRAKNNAEVIRHGLRILDAIMQDVKPGESVHLAVQGKPIVIDLKS